MRKGADHHAKYSKNKKTSRLLLSIIIGSARRLRLGERERDKRMRRALTYGIKRFELVHQRVLNCVIFARQTYIYIYIYNVSVLRILWTRADLFPRRLSARGNNNARSTIAKSD